MLLPVLGMLGLFGETITTERAANEQLAMQIEYTTRHRYKLNNNMKVTITNLSDQSPVTVTVSFDRAYLDHFSFQCGYCTPGFVNAAMVLLERLKRSPIPRYRIDETVLAAMDHNICRCTGYVRYLEAVKNVILSSPGLTKADRTPTQR